jgi:hypothetical protein
MLRQAMRHNLNAASSCAAAVGVSGVVLSAIRQGLWSGQAAGSAGYVVLGQLAAVLLLLTVGMRHHRRINEVTSEGPFRPMLGLAAGELVLIGATLALTGLAPPAP